MTVQTIQTEECVEPHGVEQGENPVPTRFDFIQAIDIAKQYILTSEGNDKRPMQVMLALIDLHAAEDRSQGFTPTEVIEAAQRYNKRIKLNVDDAGRQLRKYWDAIETAWPNTAEVLVGKAKMAGLNWIIRPEKRESSGGTGRPSRYCLVCISISEYSNAAATEIQNNVRSDATTVFYYPADVSDCGIVVRKLAEGFELIGWKRRMFLLVMISLLVAFGVILIGFIWWFTQVPIHGDLRSLVSLGLIITMCVSTTYPIFSLPTERIVKAPWWLQWQVEDILLEWRSPPRYSSKTIKAIRYTAACPICGGAVFVGAKGILINPRLRGRCIEAPNSHVFSFDHITLQGSRISDSAL